MHEVRGFVTGIEKTHYGRRHLRIDQRERTIQGAGQTHIESFGDVRLHGGERWSQPHQQGPLRRELIFAWSKHELSLPRRCYSCAVIGMAPSFANDMPQLNQGEAARTEGLCL